MFTKEQIAKLKAPLDGGKVKTRSQSGATFSYLEGWQVIDFANEVFGFDGWNRQTVMLQESSRDLVTIKKQNYKTQQWEEQQQWRVSYIAKVRITVGDVLREGTGFGSGSSKPEDIGSAIEGAIKEAETDAMKRALMTFGYGFGLALYDKTQANVADFEKLAKEQVGYGVQNGLTVKEIISLCQENNLPSDSKRFSSHAQITTLGELIENAIAQKAQGVAA